MGTVTSIDPLHRLDGSPAAAFEPGDLREAVDDRTRSLLARQRKARRGWLLRRSLLAADLIGLSLAFVLAALMYDDPTTPASRVSRERRQTAVASPIRIGA